MAGPNLEIFKFGLYLFVPIWAMLQFGDPDWYRAHVTPYREKLFPSDDRTNQMIPTDQAGVKEEIARFRAEKAARRKEREDEDTKGR
jgi:protein PET100